MKKALLLLCLVVASCEGKPASSEPEVQEGGVSVPLEASITHVQPMTGIVLWNTSSAVRQRYVQLEYSYMLYSDVCREKDVYDWSPVEKILKEAAGRGHQVVLRFRYTYPGYSCAVPDYIKSWPGYEATNAKSEGRNTEFPDWRCDELQRFHMEFHRRFAERYDKDPRLAFVEIGFGLWAEYHIYDGPFIAGRTFPSKAFQAEFIRAMDDWFHDTPWCISIDAADPKYGPFDAEPALLEGKFGNFDDSFMSKDHDDYNLSSWRFFGEERYRRAPLGGEFNYYTRADQEHALDKEGMHGRTFEGEVARFHMTFIIGNDQPRYKPMDRIKEASMSMGYRFAVKDFLVKKGKGAAVCVENTGVAPIYRDAYVAVNGIRGTYNLRKLMPGERAWIRIENGSTPATPALTIECDHLVPGQRIGYEAEVKAN
jgi:hypothetical protein